MAFPDLHPGQYAVALFHDENGNESPDSGIFGQPVEKTAENGQLAPTPADRRVLMLSGLPCQPENGSCL